jgi:uncharacterized alpha-E superfamily protein
MLSRVADNLFWISRYLERAEHVARLLDVSFHAELDLAGLTPEGYAPPWKSILAVMGAVAPDDALRTADPGRAVANWLSFSIDNPAGILSCINRARNNARSIRGTIGPDVWRAINNLYWQLRDTDFVARAKGSPHDYYTAVESGGHLFQGVCDATLPHDEGWQFLRLGKVLERADKTIRLLDVKYRQLQTLTDPADKPLVTLEYAGILKGCRAFEAYQRLTIGRVEPDRVIEFLLMDPTFPRSVRFCLEEAAAALAAIEAPVGGYRGETVVDKAVGKALADLRYTDLPQLLAGDFHAFLAGLLARVHGVARALQERYSLAA